MMYILIPLVIATIAGVIFLAISRKSSFIVRIAALGALALMVLAIIICLFIIFGGNSAAKAVNMDHIVTGEAPAETKSNILPLILFIIFILGLFLLVFITSMREHRKKSDGIFEKRIDGW